MKKMLIIGIILTSLLLLTGCGEGGDQQVGPSSTPFVGGTTALSMVFMEGAPPERIFDNGNGGFAISIRVENFNKGFL